MNIHKNARTTPYSRSQIVRRVTGLRETPKAVATALGVSQRTVAKWLARYRAEGEAGLADRSSRPHGMPGATPADVVEQVIALRRQRITGKQIAAILKLSSATVSRVLRKARLSRMRDLDPPEPVRRYEREHPGELIHIDIKKLGRPSAGWQVSRSGQASSVSAIASPATGKNAAPPTAEARARAGSSSTSASTMPRASPSARCWATRGRKAPSSSSMRPATTTQASALPSPASRHDR